MLVGVVGMGGWAGLARRSADSAAVLCGHSAVAKHLDLSWLREGEGEGEGEGRASRSTGGGTLGGTGGQKPVPIASVGKVMTAYVILRNTRSRAARPGPRIAVDAAAAAEREAYSSDESSAPVRAGQQLTERHLLELLLLPSGNNIARLPARWDAVSQEVFAAKMNRTARDLGMSHTTDTGASGIEATTTSTADDQLKPARQAIKQPVLRAVVAQRSVTGPTMPGPVTNTLLDRPGVIGLKTGSSTPAGGNLMWAVEVTSGAKHCLVLGASGARRADTGVPG
ncbi:D-alanyl-D-alanine carboxypeptidase family protein [Streptomyces sp. NPDC059009]|uniref:D-alanyl-D-alanine carboxypeptidase family protein n=1 Tax=Streptomyces sp. NPDC059009 TaxID=3346694 RepID=UPI0036B9EEBA